MESMRVCWPDHGRAELTSFTLPDPKPGELLIETEVTLISPGTERAFFLGLPNAETKFPSYPGYSSVGRVAALGEGTASEGSGNALQVGDRVVSGSGHAGHAVVRANNCWRVPDGLAPEEAVFFNMSAI